MTIAYNGKIVTEIETRAINGLSGIGFYRLLFQVEINTSARGATAVIFREIRGQIDLSVQGTTTRYLLGTAYPEKALIVDTRPTAIRSQHNFYIDLDGRQIEIVEDLRKGGDLSFWLTISGIVDGCHGPHQVTDQSFVPLLVNQKAWIDVLKRMGYGQFVLFEIPVPSSEASKELGKALTCLEKAREHFWRGHYDEAVANCRKALEELTNGLGDQEKLEESKKLYSGTREIREGMPIESRFLLIREAVRHSTHLAVHAGQSTNGTAFDRKDATFVLSTTAIILSRYLMQTIS